jgi:uncharacterized protein
MELLGAVFIASLVGSPHCAGMCGPLAVLAIGTHGAGRTSSSLWAAYHLARLVGYVLLGAIAGGLGSAMDGSGQWLGLQRVSALLAGIGMVAVGIFTLLNTHWKRAPHFALPAPMQRALKLAHQAINSFAPLPRSAGIGLLTVLLPCGWLYAFAITAAGTGSILGGASVMIVFWIGTLPALSVITLGIRRVTGRWVRHLPLATALLLIATGTYVAAGRAWVDYATLLPSTSTDLVDRVQRLPQEEMPCCHVD